MKYQIKRRRFDKILSCDIYNVNIGCLLWVIIHVTLISRIYMQTHYMYNVDMLKMEYFLSNNREKLE